MGATIHYGVGLLIVVVSLVVEHRLESAGSVVVAQGLSLLHGL